MKSDVEMPSAERADRLLLMLERADTGIGQHHVELAELVETRQTSMSADAGGTLSSNVDLGRLMMAPTGLLHLQAGLFEIMRQWRAR